MTYAPLKQESLTVEFKSDRKRLPDTELVEAVVCLTFALNPKRRAQLRYILDPADVMCEDYPFEVFRVLKNKERRDLDEYCTQRLVLTAWDVLDNGELQAC